MIMGQAPGSMYQVGEEDDFGFLPINEKEEEDKESEESEVSEEDPAWADLPEEERLWKR